MNGVDSSCRLLQDWNPADCVQMTVAIAHGRLDDPTILKYRYYEAPNSTQEGLHKSTVTILSENKHFKSCELLVLLWAQACLYLTNKIDINFNDIVPQLLLSQLEKGNYNHHDSSPSMKEYFAKIVHHVFAHSNI